MAEEITPNEESKVIEPQNEPISEPIESTIPSDPEITTIEPEPTAQIPVNEPIPTLSESPEILEAEPVAQSTQNETEPVETETQPDASPEMIPQLDPQITSEPVEETKTEIPEIVSESNGNESQSIEPVPETKIEPKRETRVEPEQPKIIPVVVPSRKLARELLVKARQMIQFRKRKKLDKVMTLFAKQTKITNDEVEKLLHVSDATATRYLSQLEKEGKIKQEGKTGKMVSYYKL